MRAKGNFWQKCKISVNNKQQEEFLYLLFCISATTTTTYHSVVQFTTYKLNAHDASYSNFFSTICRFFICHHQSRAILLSFTKMSVPGLLCYCYHLIFVLRKQSSIAGQKCLLKLFLFSRML